MKTYGKKYESHAPEHEIRIGGDMSKSYGEINSYEFLQSDCLLDPDNCDDGLTVSFTGMSEQINIYYYYLHDLVGANCGDG